MFRKILAITAAFILLAAIAYGLAQKARKTGNTEGSTNEKIIELAQQHC